MKSLVDHLAYYASYHRDRRNLATHFIGIPMILFAIVILLSRPRGFEFAATPVTPALVAAVLVGIFYLRLDVVFGLLMAVVLALMLNLAALIAAASTTLWLGWGLGLFLVGWIFQAVGHVWEGKKPAFFDDLVGLIIGPLFVLAEVVFAMGGRQELARQIEERAGKTRSG